jgi:hypothetical protein
MFPVASPLFAAVGFDLVDGIAVDWMHVICLGIVRDLIDKWLCSSTEPYFIGDKISFLDKRLLSICPPRVINRTPRTLREFTTWKGGVQSIMTAL